MSNILECCSFRSGTTNSNAHLGTWEEEDLNVCMLDLACRAFELRPNTWFVKFT